MNKYNIYPRVLVRRRQDLDHRAGRALWRCGQQVLRARGAQAAPGELEPECGRGHSALRLAAQVARHPLATLEYACQCPPHSIARREPHARRFLCTSDQHMCI